MIRKLFGAVLPLTAALVISTCAVARAQGVTLSAEVRSRSDWDRPGGALDADLATALRTRLGAIMEAARNARIVLQIQDSRVLGAESNSTATATDVFELHQGYLELSGNPRAGRLVARAGRQEIAFGNERLVGASAWTATGRAFDGLRVVLTPSDDGPSGGRWTVSAFAATIEERGRRFGAATTTSTEPEPDHATAGVFTAGTLPGAVVIEGTLLFDERRTIPSMD